MPNTKTWIVNSEKSRHPELDGETVPLDGMFSNGMSYPGDPEGGPEQNAGCTCTLDVNFESFQDPTYGTVAEHDLRVQTLLNTAPKELLDQVPHVEMIKVTRELRASAGDLTAISEQGRASVAAFDELIAKYGHEFQAPEVLSRGVYVEEGSVWFQPKIGQTWHDDAFMFTSMSEGVGNGYAAGGGWKMELVVQKGTRALPFDRHYGMFLERGQTWRVVDVDETARVVRMVSENA